MKTDTSKWLMTTAFAAAAFAFASPASAETVSPPGTIVVAESDSMAEEAAGDGEMKPDAAAPDTATDDSPTHTTSNPEGRMDDGEMEEGTVAPDTSADDGMMQKSDPDAVEEEDSSMDNEEVGDPSTD